MIKTQFYVEKSGPKGSATAPQAAKTDVSRIIFDRVRQETTQFDMQICCVDGCELGNHVSQKKKIHVKSKKMHFTWKRLSVVEDKMIFAPQGEGRRMR